MSQNAALVNLEEQHHALEREIEEELAHPGYDDLHVAELKRKKLLLKDEISRIRTS
ncbi:DUF465 domain-containing protein [Rhodobium gokarnense]|uniref:DUF465 domain-containing protein n=1 Tax=Rhodobium gokarnense TaxID=364296 RepID=A0ABT3H734_9HYPH|nr:DUF465 domain-containing protein [Rhodobium gokarnense]MCW2306149.1 hypothetical protein [Rhodobium gokarnense]